MVENEIENEIKNNDVENGALSPDPQVQSLTSKVANPFEKFYVVELHVDGIADSVNNTVDHLMTTFYRLNKDQKNVFQYKKVKFYRECKKLSSFRLNGKYVMPMDNISALEHVFREIEGDFMAERNHVYRELVNTWDDVVEQTLREHPDLGLTEEDLEKLRPTTPDFLSINYEFRSLNAYLTEMKGLKDLIMDAGDPDVAKRVDVQRNLILAQIRTQYEDKILKLKKQVDGLKEYAKKKGKKYEKALLKANTEKETIMEMADILGEKDAAETHLESLMEVLAESMINDRKSGKRDE